MLRTEVPDELFGRGIFPAQRARGFTIALDTAEPWGGGRIEGRIEARERLHDARPVTVSVSCTASWLDVAPELVGQKPFWRVETYWSIRTRIPIWLDEEVWLERWELGDLGEANWLRFSIELPPELPRALEGTFVAFRWRISARRNRRVGHDVTSLPLLLTEPRTVPCVRVETSPLGTWRLLEWRSEPDRGGSCGPCSIAFEERRPEDAPLPGETPAQEAARRGLR